MGDARPLGRARELRDREQAASTAASRRAPSTRSGAAPAALAELFEALRSPWLLVSVTRRGLPRRRGSAALLGEHGHVGRIDVDGKRYVGAQIGIYNPAGEKVGSVSHLRNREHLFLVGPDRALVESASPARRSAAGALAGEQEAPR